MPVRYLAQHREYLGNVHIPCYALKYVQKNATRPDFTHTRHLPVCYGQNQPRLFYRAG